MNLEKLIPLLDRLLAAREKNNTYLLIAARELADKWKIIKEGAEEVPGGNQNAS